MVNIWYSSQNRRKICKTAQWFKQPSVGLSAGWTDSSSLPTCNLMSSAFSGSMPSLESASRHLWSSVLDPGSFSSTTTILPSLTPTTAFLSTFSFPHKGIWTRLPTKIDNIDYSVAVKRSGYNEMLWGACDALRKVADVNIAAHIVRRARLESAGNCTVNSDCELDSASRDLLHDADISLNLLPRDPDHERQASVTNKLLPQNHFIDAASCSGSAAFLTISRLKVFKMSQALCTDCDVPNEKCRVYLF